MKVTANDIANAMEKAIQLVEELFNDLIALETEMKIFEKNFKLGKALATATNVVGAGLVIGSAILTGGLSFLAASAITTTVGTTANLVVDVFDSIKSKECLNEINRILEKFDDEIKSLQKLLETFNQQVEDTMKARNIDRRTAFFWELGMDNRESLGESFYMAGVVIMTRSIFYIENMKKIELPTYLTELLNSYFGTKFASDVSVYGTVAGIIMICLEIVNLVRILLKDHPSIMQIKAAETELHKQKIILTENLNDFKRLHKIVSDLQNEAYEKTEEIFSLMFGKVMKKPLPTAEPMSFDHYVNQIGTGREGGIYDLIFLAEMTGQTIEIHDRTENKIISALHGKDKVSVIPFTVRSHEVITLILTNENGINHYSPSSSGMFEYLTSFFNFSTYDNRCHS